MQTGEQASVDMAMNVTKLNQIRELVEEYNSIGGWRELREGLLMALDENSEAYEQLHGFLLNTTNTPSYTIGYHGYLDLATVLIEAGLEVNSADSYKCTMLHGSAYTGKIALAEYLLDHGADVNLPDRSGYTALLNSSLIGKNLAMVKLLVERGADVNRANNFGYTSLHYAAQMGRFAIVKYLVEAGADSQAKDFYLDSFKTPLDLAKRERHNRVIEYLSKFTD